MLLPRLHCILAAVLLAAPATLAANLEEDAPPAEETAAEETEIDGEEAEKEDEKDDEKEFAEIVEDFEVIDGLFTFYRDPEDNEVRMEIRPEQIGPVYLCDISRDAGDGLFYDSGTMIAGFPFVLEKVGKKIRFLHKNVYYRADAGQPIAPAVERGLTNSLVGSATIEGKPHPERGSWLVNPAGFFIKDHTGVAESLTRRAEKDYSFDKDESFFGRIRSFPRNTEIEATFHFKASKSRATNMRIPDSRSLEHRYRFSLIEIPESDYVPRVADDRVGYFITQFQDFSSLERTEPYTWYINRWNLRKANPGAKKSKPVKPITFWIENTVPLQYRDAIRRGALLWNDAFERIGFEDAVVVKQMPDDADWDPADVRYNVIRWIVMPGGSYAVGPSNPNPFTGEIYAADIRISADFVRYFFSTFEQYTNPLTAGSEIEDPWRMPPDPSHACRYSDGKAMEAAFGLDLLMARDFIEPGSKKVKKYIDDGITDLVAHEVGHTLGFRHNFRGSTLHDLASLHDTGLTSKEGVSGSVMDYNPVNIAPHGRKQGSFWCTNLGTYDYWVVEYGYTETGAKSPEDELDTLAKIASRAAEPKLAYATDEDAYGFAPQGVDPSANLWDYSPDPVAFYGERLGLADELLGKIETDFVRDGSRYTKMSTVFNRAMGQYRAAASTVSKFPGGFQFHRDHYGDPDGRTPFVPVPAEKQRAALDFLEEHIFAEDAFEFAPSLANKLAPERLPDFDWTFYYNPRVDYPIHAAILRVQNLALTRLYHPITLHRLVDFPLHVPEGTDVLTMHEMFDRLQATIWAEVRDGRDVSSTRRNLQRAHLDRLVSLVVDPQGAPFYTPASGNEPAGKLPPPEDARSFARANLVSLQEALETALGGSSSSAETRAHLDECHARVVAALTASVNRDL